MLSTAESEAPSNDERINILSSHSGWRSILDTREMNSGSLLSWVPNAIIVSSFKGVMCLTHVEEDLIRILSPIYTVGRGQNMLVGEQGATAPAPARASNSQETNKNVPGILIGASLIAACNLGWSVDFSTFT